MSLISNLTVACTNYVTAGAAAAVANEKLHSAVSQDTFVSRAETESLYAASAAAISAMNAAYTLYVAAETAVYDAYGKGA